jgi:hypothetical protein
MASSKLLRLRHEIMVVDADLEAPLDMGQMYEKTSEFIKDMLEGLGMERLAPLGMHLAMDNRAPGWSFIQPITTSHISVGITSKSPGRMHIFT